MTPYELHRGAIAGILNPREYPIEWVDNEVAQGRIVVLGDETACIGVARKDYPGGLIELHGMFAVGDKRAIRQLVQDVCAAAKQAGCDIAAIESRIGWSREFKDMGFRVERVRIVKDLSYGD